MKSILINFKIILKNKFLFVLLASCLVVNTMALMVSVLLAKDTVYPYGKSEYFCFEIELQNYDLQTVNSKIKKIELGNVKQCNLWLNEDGTLRYNLDGYKPTVTVGQGFSEDNTNQIIAFSTEFTLGEKIDIGDENYLITGINYDGKYFIVNNLNEFTPTKLEIELDCILSNYQLNKMYDNIATNFPNANIIMPTKFTFYDKIFDQSIFILMFGIIALSFISIFYCVNYLSQKQIKAFSVFKQCGATIKNMIIAIGLEIFLVVAVFYLISFCLFLAIKPLCFGTISTNLSVLEYFLIFICMLATSIFAVCFNILGLKNKINILIKRTD